MPDDLFALAQKYFNEFSSEFAKYNIQVDPNMELRRGDGMLCYYDLHDGHIYMALPDLDNPASKLYLMFIKSLINANSQEEVVHFIQIVIPHVIAHEMAHHFRHRYGMFSTDMWHEEQVANQLALAVTKHRLKPEDRAFTRMILPRALDALGAKLGLQNVAADSYHNILYALNVSGQIDDTTLANVELMQKIFTVKPEEILKTSGRLSPEIVQRLDQRDIIIDTINEKYASDFTRYLYYHIGWMHLALTSRETQYVEEFARLHLNKRVSLLPDIPPALTSPQNSAIQACYTAYLQIHPLSETGGRYFYKRYRSLLLAGLQSAQTFMPQKSENEKKEATLLLQNWTDHETDTLVYLAPLAPPELRSLFPQFIGEQIDARLSMQLHLPAETDIRLWKHIFLNERDDGAENTLHRLQLLEHTDIHHPLPAEVLLDLTHNLCWIKLTSGEIIIWEEDINDDVFILVNGHLDVLATQDRQLKIIGEIKAGEVFGEMAFFTREPRHATVRASEPSECFVLKASQLHLFGFKHPSIFVQMAGVIAKRMAQNNKITTFRPHPKIMLSRI